jgi:BlaI family penicillinase repressor
MQTSSREKPAVPTPSELRLLKVLWRIGEGTIDDLLLASREKPRPNYKTVQTLLRIMEGKGLITHRVNGRAFVFEPRVAQEQVNRLSIGSFLDRYFGGSRTELLMNLLEDKRVDADELRALEKLVRQHRKSKMAAIDKAEVTKTRK